MMLHAIHTCISITNSLENIFYFNFQFWAPWNVGLFQSTYHRNAGKSSHDHWLGDLQSNIFCQENPLGILILSL